MLGLLVLAAMATFGPARPAAADHTVDFFTCDDNGDKDFKFKQKKNKFKARGILDAASVSASLGPTTEFTIHLGSADPDSPADTEETVKLDLDKTKKVNFKGDLTDPTANGDADIAVKVKGRVDSDDLLLRRMKNGCPQPEFDVCPPDSDKPDKKLRYKLHLKAGKNGKDDTFKLLGKFVSDTTVTGPFGDMSVDMSGVDTTGLSSDDPVKVKGTFDRTVDPFVFTAEKVGDPCTGSHHSSHDDGSDGSGSGSTAAGENGEKDKKDKKDKDKGHSGGSHHGSHKDNGKDKDKDKDKD
jgi:hypothetical protein